MRFGRFHALCLLSAAALLVVLSPAFSQTPARPVVNLYVFLSPDCPTCEPVKEDVLKKTAVKLGCTIVPRYFDVEDMTNYRILVTFEAKYGDTENDLPVVVIGDRLLGGVEEVKANLPGLLAKYAAGAGVEALPLPGKEEIQKALVIPTVENTVHVVFFDRPGCRRCTRADNILAHLQNELGRTAAGVERLKVDRVVAVDDKTRVWHEVLGGRAGLTEDKRLVTPAVFVSTDSLVDKRITDSAVIGLLSRYRKGVAAPKPPTEHELAAARDRIVSRFEKLGPWTVVIAGLIDGINPCAFATIVFFITYLSATGRGRREILAVGLCFSAAVFATYFAVGLGALQTILKLRIYAQVSKTIDIAAGVAAALFGFLSMWDYFKARKGKIDEMRLVLPSFLKRKINVNISRQLRLRGVVIGAIVAGGLVSLFELACTGQVYLPTIALISGNLVLRVKGVAFLVLYNLMFILPLLAILATVNFGMSSETLSGIFRRNIALSKLALAALFFAIAAVVFLTLFGH